MATNFKKIARQETIISDLMEGREKVQKTDGNVHIEDFDIVSDPNGQAYAICAIGPDKFINGGFVLTKIVTAFIDEFGGDVQAAREAFKQEGGLDVKLTKKKTKNGRDIVTVDVL